MAPKPELPALRLRTQKWVVWGAEKSGGRAGRAVPLLRPGADGGRFHSPESVPGEPRSRPRGRGRKGPGRERARRRDGVGLARQPEGVRPGIALTAASPRRS